MQEFRPASVIADDTALAERFRDGDADAIRELVGRYGSAVAAVVTPTLGADRADDVVLDVFVRAHRQPVVPGGDFAPWLAGMAGDAVGPVDERLWTCAMATSSIDPDVRPLLRSHHLGGDDPLTDQLTRHELRLRRRLDHLGDTDEILTALADRDAWVEAPPDLAERVLAAIDPDQVFDGREVDTSTAVERDGEPAENRSAVTRFMRPALFGLGGGLVVLFVAIVALSAASGTPTPPNYTAELTPTGAIVEVEPGEITVTERDAGIEIALDAATLPRRAAGAFYEGRLVLGDGTELSAGTFAEGVDVTLWVGARLDDAVRFEVLARDAAGTADRGDVILKADLPPD